MLTWRRLRPPSGAQRAFRRAGEVLGTWAWRDRTKVNGFRLTRE